MRAVIYFAHAPGAHPNCKREHYDIAWPVMYRQLKANGYDLTLLTTNGAEVDYEYDERIEFDGDPATPPYTREHIWYRFLRLSGPNDQFLMVEPDTYVCRRVPDMLPDSDLVLFQRDRPPVPTCLRLCRGRAWRYYSEIAHLCDAMTYEKKRWWCEVETQTTMLGGHIIPPEFLGLKIEKRDAIDYCMPPNRGSDNPVVQCFNGTKKLRMR